MDRGMHQSHGRMFRALMGAACAKIRDKAKVKSLEKKAYVIAFCRHATGGSAIAPPGGVTM